MGKETIYKQLEAAGFSKEGICALMGNFKAESEFNPTKVELNRISMSDEEYTWAVDNGVYGKFVSDRIGYGIYQLTYPSRKMGYLAYVTNLGLSIGDESAQVDYCIRELMTDCRSLYNYLKTTNDITTATSRVCKEFEKPNVNNIDTRIKYAKELYSEFSSGKSIKSTGGASMYDKNKVISIAEKEIGYLEKASNAYLDDKTANAGSANYTKYARDLAAISGLYNGNKQGYAWCDVFVDWCFVQAYGAEAAKALLCQPNYSAGAGCTYSMQYYKNKGQFYTSNPVAGDQIFFGTAANSTHTGLVYKVDSVNVYTIEGNTSGASGVVANGGGVCKKSYPLSYGSIVGYGRPNYSSVSSTTTVNTVAQSTNPATTTAKTSAQFSITLSEMSYKSEGVEVKWLQEMLNLRGFNCGTPDGEFGAMTQNAVKKAQSKYGLRVDGCAGKDTCTALIRDGK